MPGSIEPSEFPLVTSTESENLEDAIALCLSGGGYRAMIFHVGVLWYLEDAGILAKLGRISSVSGGSITSGVLALAWTKLSQAADRKKAFQDLVVAPLRRMAGTSIDTKSVLSGVLGPGSVSDRVIKQYKEILFGKHTLQEQLINFGYGMAERALRSYYDPNAFAPAVFPYARGI